MGLCLANESVLSAYELYEHFREQIEYYWSIEKRKVSIARLLVLLACKSGKH